MSNTPRLALTNRRTRIWIFLSSVLILTLACSTPGFFNRQTASPEPPSKLAPTASIPTPTAQPLPPDMVEVHPVVGMELPLDKSLTLYFNQPMDRPSVEAALSVEPALPADLNWANDFTLVLEPLELLPLASEFTVTIGTQASSANGLTLIEPIQLTYRTVGYLHMSQALPEPNVEEVNPTSAIVATFDRPVVALGADPATIPIGFEIEPGAHGRGEWLNTSTYIYYPEPALEGGQTYTVSLNPNLRSADGSPLEVATRWTFSTALPELVSVEASSSFKKPESNIIPIDSEFILSFNQPMDPESLEANFNLLATGSIPVQGEINWNEDLTALTYTPKELLARNSEYELVIGPNAQARGGAILSAASFNFQTVSTLAVTNSDPAPGGIKLPYAGVTLYFNGPLQAKDIRQYVTVIPAITNQDAWWNEYDQALYLYGDFLPETDYTINLSANLPDPWGGDLANGYTLNFRTAPLNPALVITTGTDVLYLTPQDQSLTAQITNLYQMPMSLGSTSLEDFFKMISGENAYEFRQSYRAPDQRDWIQSLADLQPNRNQAVELYLEPDRKSLEPGLYYLRFNLTDERIYAGPYPLVVSDIHLTMKLSATDALVWAVDLQEDKPIASAPVTLYDQDGQVVVSGQTDSNGIFQSAIPPLKNPYDTYYAVLGQPGEDDFGLVLSTWDHGTSPWDFGLTADYTGPRLKAYLYTDRPIYRPGQTVYFRGVVRQSDNGRYTLPDLARLPLTLYNQNGEEMTNFDLPLSVFGSIHDQYTLPADAQPGYYYMASKSAEYDGSVSFQVAEYRKPEINLQVEFASPQIQAGQSLVAHVNARYFFDAPAGNIPVKWSLSRAPSSFSLPGYQVGIEDTRWLDAYYFPGYPGFFGEIIDQGESATNPQGTLNLEFPSESQDERQKYRLEITTTDESGLPVSARAEIEVNPGSIYIGVRPEAWVGRAGDESNFEILVVDWVKSPAGEQDLFTKFEKVVWEQEPSEDPYLGPKFIPNYTLIASSDFSTDKDGMANLSFTPPEPGTYQLSIASASALTEMLLWVSGPGQAIWPNLPNQRLRLTADQQEYQPGDTANVFIPNPFGESVLAFITIERGAVLHHQVTRLDAQGETFNIPLTGDEAPNVYLAVTILGRNAQGRPDFRQGFLIMPVAPIEQTLQVELTSQPERTGPGEEVTFEVQVTDADGKPIHGEFSFSVVDLAVLALAEPNAPDILSAFYGEQPLGVRTGLNLAAYAHRNMLYPPGAGGGGGDAVPPVVRERFPDTAFWEAQLITDADGRAQVHLLLPDSLTTWQVSARGVTENTLVGQAETQVTTSKELLVRPVTPRFLVVGDHIPLAAVLHNNTPDELQAKITLRVTGFTLDEPANATQGITIPPQSRARVEWWGTAQDASHVDPVFSVQAVDPGGNQYQDATRSNLGKLPILKYVAPETFRTSGSLDQGEERLELVSLPRSFDPQSGQLQLELTSSLAGSIMSALSALEHFPYECTEQTLSRFLPNLETYRTLQAFGISSPTLQEQLERTLSQGLERLQNSQNPDGGWSWWPGGESDPYVSAYILFGLSQAQQADVVVSEETLNSAIEYIQAALTGASSNLDPWQLDRQVFAYFALTQAGVEFSPGVADLYQARDRLSPWAQALLSLTMESLSPGSPEARTMLSNLETTAIRSSTGVHWEESQPGWQNMTTPVSTTAMVVYVLAQRDPDTPLLADAVRYLMSHRQIDNAWGSTYSSAWTILALSEVMKGTGELGGDFSYSATLNNKPVISGQTGSDGIPARADVPLSELYPNDPNALVIQRDPGSGRLYYTTTLNVYQPVETVLSSNRGINVSRVYRPVNESCQRNDCETVSEGQVGEQLQVHLTLTLQDSAYYLLVEDYLPAGAEVIDTSLETSQQIIDDFEPEVPKPLFDPIHPFREGWGWWYFGEPLIFDDHVAWAVDYLPAGTYELTYTLTLVQPGQYKILPGRAWQFYFPEVQGNSEGSVFSIAP